MESTPKTLRPWLIRSQQLGITSPICKIIKLIKETLTFLWFPSYTPLLSFVPFLPLHGVVFTGSFRSSLPKGNWQGSTCSRTNRLHVPATRTSGKGAKCSTAAGLKNQWTPTGRRQRREARWMEDTDGQVLVTWVGGVGAAGEDRSWILG